MQTFLLLDIGRLCALHFQAALVALLSLLPVMTRVPEPALGNVYRPSFVDLAGRSAPVGIDDTGHLLKSFLLQTPQVPSVH